MKTKFLFIKTVCLILFWYAITGCSEDELIATDIEGNSYKTVKIGNQVWMAENLDVPKYADGTPIQYANDNNPYLELDDGKYTYLYNNYFNSKNKYGALYNYEAAQNACPDGWHLPSDSEWLELQNYLIKNGYNYDGTTEGNKIGKSLASTSGWGSSRSTETYYGKIGDYQEKNNKSGFNAVPGGYCNSSAGSFKGVAAFWTSSIFDDDSRYAWSYGLSSGSVGLNRFERSKNYYLSVRCIKD